MVGGEGEMRRMPDMDGLLLWYEALGEVCGLMVMNEEGEERDGCAE